MMTMTCTLTFKDGATATGIVSASTPYDENTVVYTGKLARMPRHFPKATPGLLRILFKNIADETGAELSVKMEGEYDVAE